MPMEKEKYEGLLNELNDPEISHERRSEILQSLRTDYTQVHQDHEELSTTSDKLQKEKEDLSRANSKLFLQLGTEGNPDLDKKEEEKEFSETITLEEIEKNAQF